eukprot:642147_1
MELPLTKYLNLKKSNAPTQHMLQSFVTRNMRQTFRGLATGILRISVTDSDELYEQIRLMLPNEEDQPSMPSESQDHDLIDFQEESKSQSISVEPSTPHLNSIKTETVTNPFKVISKADDYMKTNQNVHQTTCDKVTVIKQMQFQYDKERLSIITKQTLNTEFNVRVNLIDCERTIKSDLDSLITSLQRETRNDKHLLEMQIKNEKNRQKQRNREQCQHNLQTLLNETERISKKMNTTAIQVEEYVLDRNLLMRTDDGQYFGRLDCRTNKIQDCDVTNFFIANLNTLMSRKEYINVQSAKFILHIQSRKYETNVGKLEEIRSGYLEHERKAEQRKKEYKETTSMISYYREREQIQLTHKDVQKMVSTQKGMKGAIIEINKKYGVENGNIDKMMQDIKDGKVKSKPSTHSTRKNSTIHKKKTRKKKAIDRNQTRLDTFFQVKNNKKRTFNAMNNHNTRSHEHKQPLRKKQRLSMCSAMKVINLDVSQKEEASDSEDDDVLKGNTRGLNLA